MQQQTKRNREAQREYSASDCTDSEIEIVERTMKHVEEPIDSGYSSLPLALAACGYRSTVRRGRKLMIFRDEQRTKTTKGTSNEFDLNYTLFYL